MGIIGPRYVDDAQTDYTPVALANYFVKQFGADEGISHMKLQKLVYLAYGWWLSHYENPSSKRRLRLEDMGPSSIAFTSH